MSNQSCCWSCNVKLTAENSSSEHIILNACGGSLKSRKLLCKRCNKSFGEKYDAELAEQVNPIANYLMIKRDRDRPQPIVGKLESDGTEYKILHNGKLVKSKPEVKIERNGEKINIRVSASSDSQFNDVINGLIKKFPMLKREDILAGAKRGKYFMDEPISSELSVGGPGPFRSLAKTAINYYIYKGGDSLAIKDFIPFLLNESEPHRVWHYYPETMPYEPMEKEITHVILIHGKPEEKILYAYVELFSYIKVLIFLSDNYDGPAFRESYVFDPVNRINIEVNVNLDLNREILLNYFNNKLTVPISKINNNINRVWAIADDIQTSYHLNKQIKEAVLANLKNVPLGTIMTEELCNELFSKVITDVLPFVEHQNKRREPRVKH